MAPRKKPTTLVSVDRRIAAIDLKVDRLDERVGHLDAKVDHLDAKVDHLDAKVDHLDKKVDDVDKKIDDVDKKIDNVVFLLGEKFEESKRFMRILTEELRGEFRNLADKLVAMDEKSDRRLTRLEKHAGF